MRWSLHTRLLAWNSLLLLAAMVLFSLTVLWLYWRMVVPQFDESLEAVSSMAANVLSAELDEHVGLMEAAGEVERVVRDPDYVVAVLDGAGSRTAADVTLSRGSRDEDEYREALAVVGSQSARLARLVDDMLVLARSDGGGYPILWSEIDLDVLVTECVRELTPAAAARGIALTARAEPVAVTADESLVRRLATNLLTNALTHTPEGGQVDVRVCRAGNEIEIRVADTGPGVPAAERERIFERFVRLDPARSTGGSGLGLSIARWIAEVHGGRLTLVSTGSAGSLFVAALPVEHPQPDAPVA